MEQRVLRTSDFAANRDFDSEMAIPDLSPSEMRKHRVLGSYAINGRFDVTGSFVTADDAIAPSKAWEGRLRCNQGTLRPFIGTLRVEIPFNKA